LKQILDGQSAAEKHHANEKTHAK